MIKGIGTDVLEISRVAKLMSDKFVQRILHRKEIELLNSMTHETRRISFVAGRFCVKEAYAKANGTGIGQAMRFNEICCLNDELGKPYIDGQSNVHVSISHSETIATAFVIIENSDEK